MSPTMDIKLSNPLPHMQNPGLQAQMKTSTQSKTECKGEKQNANREQMQTKNLNRKRFGIKLTDNDTKIGSGSNKVWL